jgi:hypothetical protein
MSSCAAAGQDAPVDFGQAELRVFGRDRDVAPEQRAIAAAEAPAVDHRHGRLLVPAQPLEPAVALALAPADRTKTLGLGHAEILQQVHPGGPGGAFAGQHQHLHVVAELELFEYPLHLPVELRAHAVALVGTVEIDPRDAIDDVVTDGFFLGTRIGLGRLRHGWLS